MTRPLWEKGLSTGIELPCDVCDGTGQVDEFYPLRVEQGEIFRKNRMGADLSLREFCKKYGMNTVRISQFERGKKLDLSPEEVKILQMYDKPPAAPKERE